MTLLGKVFGALVCLSFVFAGVSGRMNDICTAGLRGAGEAVTLSLSLCGSLCLWSGVIRVLDKAGLTHRLTHALLPLLKRMYSKKLSAEALHAIAANYSANFLGLGNAALPLGLRAMQCIKQDTRASDTASDDMVLFASLNTAPFQLLPTTLAALRASHGSTAPFDMLVPTWLCMACTLLFGLILCKALARLFCARARKGSL